MYMCRNCGIISLTGVLWTGRVRHAVVTVQDTKGHDRGMARSLSNETREAMDEQWHEYHHQRPPEPGEKIYTINDT